MKNQLLKIMLFIVVALIIVIVGCDPHDQEIDHHAAADSGSRPKVLKLPPRLKKVLLEEMIFLESGMQSLIPSLARRDAKAGERIALKMHGSFILKQSLSSEELKVLVSLLPEEFVKQDRFFHGRAKDLAQAFQKRDFKQAADLYGELTRACVSCHERYVSDTGQK